MILEKKRCFEESIEYFDKAFNIDNSFITALFNKGIQYNLVRWVLIRFVK